MRTRIKLNDIHANGDPPCMENKRVRIWSDEHLAWWRPDRSGYTSSKELAGIYSFEDAFDATWMCGPGKQIVYETVEEAPTAPIPDITAERAAFEAWFTRDVGSADVLLRLNRRFDDYESDWVGWAWRGFAARAGFSLAEINEGLPPPHPARGHDVRREADGAGSPASTGVLSSQTNSAGGAQVPPVLLGGTL